MHPYSFTVSLRASHPSQDLCFLSDFLSIERKHGWVAGEPRKTPKGTALGGTRKESYWSAYVTDEEISSEQWQLEVVLHKSVDHVLSLENRLAPFFASGGAMNYFVALSGVRNYGLILSPDLMGKLRSAGIELQLDIYPSQCAI